MATDDSSDQTKDGGRRSVADDKQTGKQAGDIDPSKYGKK